MSVVASVDTALFNECADTVWLPREDYPTASKARYAAFRLLADLGCVDPWFVPGVLKVSKVWSRYEPDGEYDEWPWKACAETDEGAVAKWEARVSS